MPGRPQPCYADGFRCTGSECEDNCCGGWGIYVDKATYKKYRASPFLRGLAAQHLRLNVPRHDNFQYARIRFTPEGKCPFLGPDRLCVIHKQHGAEFLCKSCARYPRAYARFEGALEKALYLSCPEAARMVLLGQPLLPPPNGEAYRDFLLENSQDRPSQSSGSLPQLLRSFALQLLRDGGYPLWQRLLLLGIVCRRIDGPARSQQSTEVAVLLAQYAQMIVEGRLRPSLDAIPARPGLQLDLVLQLIRRRFVIEQPDQGFATVVGDFLLGIHRSPEVPLQESAKLYHEACSRYYQPFAEAYPHFLENYLINYLVRTRFPFPDTNRVQRQIDPLPAFLLMAFHYRLLHSLLIGVAARYRESFSSTHAIEVARRFARGIEHHVSFLDELTEFVRSPELCGTDGLAVVLRS